VPERAQHEAPPADIPLPASSYVTSTRTQETEGHAYRQIVVVSPTTIDELARFLVTEWPGAGIVRGEGDREEHELETSFYTRHTTGSLLARSDFCDTSASEVTITTRDR